MMTAALEIRLMCVVAKYIPALLMTLRLLCSEVVKKIASRLAVFDTFLRRTWPPAKGTLSVQRQLRVLGFRNAVWRLYPITEAFDQ